MAAVTRIGDSCTGHGSFPPRVNDAGSGDVFANGIGVHRQGDHWVTHCAGSCHDSTLASGSAGVFVNGKGVGRIGDPVACGSFVAEGSPDVFAGNSGGGGGGGRSMLTGDGMPITDADGKSILV